MKVHDRLSCRATAGRSCVRPKVGPTPSSFALVSGNGYTFVPLPVLRVKHGGGHH
ncbi:hypothetical protein N136_01599 [Leifsonia aquatica ATCC 14665]|uniref:Uncharacterized protein n=1 Tax=Leifsonia aquatica ATCC 14665 TaxID=1358026 RepID=U2RU39_LEIAQ|nr:hypothetical protein N136_01599 [Leifsonia aquatica ATCC 14665]